MLFFIFYLVILSLLSATNGYVEYPGPLVIATKGEIWPKPLHKVTSSGYFLLTPSKFQFNSTREVNCYGLLNDALTRYWDIIKNSGKLDRRGRFAEIRNSKNEVDAHFADDEDFLGVLTNLNVVLSGDCASDNILPEFDMIENYTLTINSLEATLKAPSIWGILRGLESFSQLIYLQNDLLVINATVITDAPRFPHRGLLLDTSRHFIPVWAILQTLDAMSFNKLNVFHWHITDDQSFPFKSRTFPELSEKGAYHPVSKVYEPSDVKTIIEYARVRGIRVIPEFDTPGHTRSWGVSHPELLTQCYSKDKPNGDLGPMDPTKNSTYTFLKELFTEVIDTFPDEYFHIGGDEVDFDCWQSNPYIHDYMTRNNITSYKQLESGFIQNVVDTLNALKAKYLVWEEVFVNGVALPNSTVVHVWRGSGFDTMLDVTTAGKYALFSSCWYLDHLENGGDWQKYYECDPLDFPGTAAQKELVLGGEACMWAEVVNEYNLMSRVWPRASAAAEKLWSDAGVKDLEDAKKRLEEHSCRMNIRGIWSQPPNGPGVCL